jgi:hypothetical protein
LPRRSAHCRSERQERERDRCARDGGREGATAANLRDEQREKERGKGGVEAEALRIAEGLAGRRADDGAADPAGVEDEPGADEETTVVAPVRPARDRPGLVDDQLRFDQTARRTAVELGCDGKADRRVTGVQECGGGYGRSDPAARSQDRRRCELR